MNQVTKVVINALSDVVRLMIIMKTIKNITTTIVLENKKEEKKKKKKKIRIKATSTAIAFAMMPQTKSVQEVAKNAILKMAIIPWKHSLKFKMN
jgi:hypothetical protein